MFSAILNIPLPWRTIVPWRKPFTRKRLLEPQASSWTLIYGTFDKNVAKMVGSFYCFWMGRTPSAIIYQFYQKRTKNSSLLLRLLSPQFPALTVFRNICTNLWTMNEFSTLQPLSRRRIDVRLSLLHPYFFVADVHISYIPSFCQSSPLHLKPTLPCGFILILYLCHCWGGNFNQKNGYVVIKITPEGLLLRSVCIIHILTRYL